MAGVAVSIGLMAFSATGAHADSGASTRDATQSESQGSAAMTAPFTLGGGLVVSGVALGTAGAEANATYECYAE